MSRIGQNNAFYGLQILPHLIPLLWRQEVITFSQDKQDGFVRLLQQSHLVFAGREAQNSRTNSIRIVHIAQFNGHHDGILHATYILRSVHIRDGDGGQGQQLTLSDEFDLSLTVCKFFRRIGVGIGIQVNQRTGLVGKLLQKTLGNVATHGMTHQNSGLDLQEFQHAIHHTGREVYFIGFRKCTG